MLVRMEMELETIGVWVSSKDVRYREITMDILTREAENSDSLEVELVIGYYE